MATLVAVAMVAPLAAFATLVARGGFYVHHNTRAELEAFYTAEAGLEHALAEIPHGGSFRQLANGPDGLAGTADDGEFPFREGRPTFFPRPPLHYLVRLELINAQ